jgi:FdrA protein
MIRTQIRHGAYYDSVVLMQLQRALARLPNVVDAGVVMGTPANRDLLEQSDLLTPEAAAAGTDDLILVVRGVDAAAADAALVQVDALLARRMAGDGGGDYRPKSLAAAAALAPAANWVLISTPGRYAAGVAREALALGKHVFLYSDNVPLEDEVALKRQAAAQGLLVLGPDCGTAIVNGVGLGFANRVRRGPVGVVGAAGTGLQQVTARIHQLGSGISHALGTGGRDLSEAVGAVTTGQVLDLLLADSETQVVVMISKPPAAPIAARVVAQARRGGKPVVVNFVGQPPQSQDGPVHFVATLDEAAELALRLAAAPAPETIRAEGLPFAPSQRYVRGLYSGGTLAYEAQLLLREYVAAVHSNAPLATSTRLARAAASEGHTVVDLGDDAFTVGRLHPMLDHEMRIRRLAQEAADPETAVILLDVVLGDGAHPDPAGELAPAIAAARTVAQADGRSLEVIAAVVGTAEDPQGLEQQMSRLAEAGAWVTTRHADAVRRAGELVRGRSNTMGTAVSLEAIHRPVHAINVGLETFAQSLRDQGVPVVAVEWRPPAGGDERLMGILARMKQPRP